MLFAYFFQSLILLYSDKYGSHAPLISKALFLLIFSKDCVCVPFNFCSLKLNVCLYSLYYNHCESRHFRYVGGCHKFILLGFKQNGSCPLIFTYILYCWQLLTIHFSFLYNRYILEGKELEFYMKKLQRKKGKGAAAQSILMDGPPRKCVAY